MTCTDWQYVVRLLYTANTSEDDEEKTEEPVYCIEFGARSPPRRLLGDSILIAQAQDRGYLVRIVLLPVTSLQVNIG